MAEWSIVRFKVLPDFKIEVGFADGTSGIADLAPRLSQGPKGDVLDALCDPVMLSRVFLKHGALTWPGDIDLAPDAIYELIRATGRSQLLPSNQRVT